MYDVPLIISSGTIVFLLIACFITFFFYSYQKRLNAYLREKEERENRFQQEMLKAQLEVQEQTFLTISQEIHDNIGQILSLTRLNISTIVPEDHPAALRKIAASKELLDQAIEDLRDLSKRLNAEFVRQQPLSESLAFQLNLIQKTGIHRTHLERQGHEVPLEPEKKLILFRIAQEALNNVIRHAEAGTIWVHLHYLPDGLELSIKDDGKGLAPAALPGEALPAKGIGITNMHYRAQLIGAQFSIRSEPGTGTLAHLKLSVGS